MNKISNSSINIEKNIFYIVSIIFLIIFVYYAYQSGITYGFKIAFFIWALTVTTTPISTASVLWSFPIKIFTNIPMFVSKFIISILSLFILYYFYTYNYSIINSVQVGKAFIKIVKLNLYLIILISIVASVICSYLLDVIVDYFIINPNNYKINVIQLISLSILFICLNIMYFKILIKNNIVGINKKYYLL
uniref:Uncharacterized protein n=1 Tax=Florenciella sp. virus SA2 TaxID=3240092 RepID=A0AB39JAE2_9VIRU